MLAYKKSRDRAYIKAEDPSKLTYEPFDLTKVTAAIDPTIEAENLTLVSHDQFLKHPISEPRRRFCKARRS
jgi:ribosome recycling factor